jgi:orotate phosphoribosyltransferase
MRHELDILARMKAVADIYPAGSGHFVYTSDMHGDGYVDYRPLGKPKHSALLREVSVLLLMKAISNAGFHYRQKIVVIGPETMGANMIDSLEAAKSLGELPNLTPICTRKLLKDPNNEGSFVWSADPTQVVKGAKTIWMDDLLNMGSTAKTCIKMIEQCGGSVDIVATIGDRGNVSAEQIGTKRIVSLEKYSGFTVHDPSVCSQCLAKNPIVRKPGHGHEFEKNNPNYIGGFIDHISTQ